jgi:flavin reductase (DIM6/NTAB) family NADH-FMN oxidoreductase RutF
MKTGLTAEYVDKINAPFVKESSLKYALILKEIIPIELNGTLLVIGEITDIFCSEHAVKADGYIDLEALNTIAITGLDSYHTSNRLSRVSYAKPDTLLSNLSIDGKT